VPWITVILSMAAAVSLTLAAVHLRAWVHDRDSKESLLFALAALFAVAIALVEAWLMHARSPGDYAERLRWLHLPVGATVITLAWFIPAYLRAGRRWLAWLITAARVIVMAVNFLTPAGATFQRITDLRAVTLFGETLTAPIGVSSPWRALAQLSTVLLLAHAADAGLTARRLQARGHPLVLAAAIAYATVQSSLFSNLMVRGILPGPFISLAFFVIVVVMAYEMSSEMIRSRRIARDLAASQARMRLAARAADLVLWEWDVRRDEVWIAGGERQRTGSPDGSLMTLDRFLEFVHPDDRTATREAVVRAMAGEREFAVECRQLAEDGTTRYLSLQGTVERDARGNALLVRGAARDMTVQRRAEADLESRKRELARLQRVSTIEQFSSALVHELSQPLGAILRNAETAELLLGRDPVDLDEIRAIVRDVLADDQRASLIIERMRALLKRRGPTREPLSVGSLIAEIEALVQAELRARGAALSVKLEPGLPDALGDRVHVPQVFLNLLGNALDAVEDQPPDRRTILIRAASAEAGVIEFAVTDRGAGFPLDQVERIFEPFHSLKSDGVGLGLWVSRMIVESHGGRIWAESNPEGGATFRFTLEAAAAPEDE